MKKTLWICLLLIGIMLLSHNQSHIHAEESDPPYAKWGQIAMKETKAKYPHADIIDYLHIGREVESKTSKEKFKLLLRENNREFGVLIDITFDNETEEMTNITFQETD